jgi:acetyl-CoA carboxylase biotin carboxyl carrier protein
MTKIDKTDLENIKLIVKESKINGVAKIKIKKNDYEIEITSNDFVENNVSVQKKEKNTELKEVENTNEVVNEDNIVKSPMVGVAYLSADPNSQPYVKVGQHVKAGDTLLLIEAMKTFNEIKAPRSGIIKKIVTLNSQPVEYGDTLIIFE